MVVWFSREMTCPMCRTRLCGREVGGGFAVGQDSDLLVRMRGKHIIQAEIHTCQNCRYCGYTKDFAINSTPELGERFCAEVTPQLTGGPTGSISSTPLSDIQYYWAYESAKFLNRSSLNLGTRLLRAYWCLRLAPSSHLPQTEIAKRKAKYLAGCIHHFKQSLRGNRNPHLYYLLGELNRRLGDCDVATSYLEKFLAKRSTAKYLRTAANKLVALTNDGDSRELTMEELLYDHKTESS
jgi:uncharacterized protein (DUF2225 family)